MEKIIFNESTANYEYMFSSDLAARNYHNDKYDYLEVENDILDTDTIVFRAISLDAIIDLKIRNVLFDYIYYSSKHRRLSFRIGDLILGKGVIKSKTLKSVYHFATEVSIDYPIVDNGKEWVQAKNKPKILFEIEREFIKYNLPEKFRNDSFNCVIAIEKGPFVKQRLGKELIDVPPFYIKEVQFVGSFYECLEKIMFDNLHEFLSDVLAANIQLRGISLFEKYNDEVLKNRMHECYNSMDFEVELLIYDEEKIQDYEQQDRGDLDELSYLGSIP